MKTIIHTPGTLSVPGVDRAVGEYVRRIADWTLEHRDQLPAARDDNERWITLDREGSMTRTEEIHRWLQGQANRSVPTVRFLIGGKEGLAQPLVEQSDWRWSLGPQVMNQSIAALVVAEQLYRCFALRTDHPYHERSDSRE